MASYYVDSNAAGAGTGADWANAYTTLTAALSGKSAGDIFYIAHNHSESTAGAVTLNSPGTEAAPCYFICVNSAGSVPPVQADVQTRAGTIANTGANDFKIGSGHGIWVGLNFSAAGGGANNADLYVGFPTGYHRLFKCALIMATTSSGRAIYFSNGDKGGPILDDVQLTFGSTGQVVAGISNFEWRNTASALQGATIPTTLFGNPFGQYTSYVKGVDLSAAGSGKTLVAASTRGNRMIFDSCKLGSSVTPSATHSSSRARTDLINCDSADTNYRQARYMYSGSQVIETTIVRTGGANDGNTALAWKLTSTANANKGNPYESFPIRVWNETVGASVSVTLEIITDNVTLKDNELWVDAQYLGTSGFPLFSKATNFPGFVDAGTNIPTSSAAWTTTGLTTPVKQKITVTFTPQEKGYIELTIYLGKASTTAYVCPKITSDTTQDRNAGGTFLNEITTGSGGGGGYIF